jgi:hypothetical protein
MNSPAAPRQRLIRHHRMQHLVIKHVAQKPERDKRLIERRINSDHAIFFLDRAKDEIFSGTMLSPATPRDFVAAKTPAKIPFVQVIKDRAQIEMRSLVPQIQLSLHRQFWVRKFSLGLSLCLFCHRYSPKTKQVETTLVAFKSSDKPRGEFCDKISQATQRQMIIPSLQALKV